MTEAVTIPTTRNRYDAPWGLCTRSRSWSG
jgi:hypothetical protein